MQLMTMTWLKNWKLSVVIETPFLSRERESLGSWNILTNSVDVSAVTPTNMSEKIPQ